jgi:drug/metabolite transporter (DMT)-like permease
MPPLVLAFWRDLFLVLTLASVMALGHRRDLLRLPKGHMAYLAAYGFVLAAYNGVLTHSVAANGASISTILVYTSAVFTALLGRFLLSERLGRAQWSAIGLCLAGCWLVAGVSASDARGIGVIGVAIGVASGLAYAIYSLMGRSAGTSRGLNPWTTLLYTFAYAAAFLLAANVASSQGYGLPGAVGSMAEIFWLGRQTWGWACLAILGGGPTLLGFGLYGVTLSLLPSSVANLLVTAEVPLTALLAFGLLGERLTLVQLGGSLLVLAGVIVIRRWEVR